MINKILCEGIMENSQAKTHKAITGKGSVLSKYQDVIVGSRSLIFLCYYEWCVWLSVIPGALGLLLRKIFWPRLFGSCGKNVAFAPGIILRHPRRIYLGDSVVISENCILDARNRGEERVIVLGDNVILADNVVLSCKTGTITIGRDSGINSGCMVQSTNNCPVTIGNDAVIGQMTFLVGGGSYNIDRLNIPIRLQGIKADSGVVVGDGVWLGGNVTVLGGVTIGEGAVVAAAAVVTKSMPPFSISRGVPARVTGNREKEN